MFYWILALLHVMACPNHAPPPTSRQSALGQAQIGAEALAVAGLTPAEACAVADRIAGDDEGLASTAAAAQALQETLRQIDEISRRLASTPGDESLLSVRQALFQSRDTGISDLATRRHELLVVGLTAGNGAGIASVARYESHADVDLAPEFRVLSWNNDELRRLSRAIRAERRALRAQITLDSESTHLLASSRADAGVVQARQSLDANLAAIEACLAAQ